MLDGVAWFVSVVGGVGSRVSPAAGGVLEGAGGVGQDAGLLLGRLVHVRAEEGGKASYGSNCVRLEEGGGRFGWTGLTPYYRLLLRLPYLSRKGVRVPTVQA